MNAEATRERTADWYVGHLEADAERFARALESASADTPVPSCPGWDLGRLAEHLGQIHRWAHFCVTHPDGPPTAEQSEALESFEPDRAADWLREGVVPLAESLRSVDPGAATWHPFPVERVARVWPRRQAHETALHRWDAEQAAGIDAPLDAELSSDGIDEYFELVIPRLVVREGIELPTGSLHVHCTDVDGEWLVWTEDGGLQMVREHQKGDAVLRGPAASILLGLWGRADDNEIDSMGDPAVLSEWMAISGM